MNEMHGFQVSSWYRLKTISINVHKTPVECFEYSMASWASEGGRGAKTPLDFEIKKRSFS